MKTWYCTNCGEITDTRIVERKQKFSVKGKPITRTTQARICSHFGEEIIDEDLDGATLLLFMMHIESPSGFSLRKTYAIEEILEEQNNAEN